MQQSTKKNLNLIQMKMNSFASILQGGLIFVVQVLSGAFKFSCAKQNCLLCMVCLWFVFWHIRLFANAYNILLLYRDSLGNQFYWLFFSYKLLLILF